ncbi:MAG: hypothetical protein ABJA87_08285 [bacterium]
MGEVRRSVSVTGGVAGVEARYDDLAIVSRTFATAAGDLAERSWRLHRMLADPALLAAAVLDPTGSAAFTATLLAALDGRHGLTWQAAAWGLTAGTVRGAAAAYLAADRIDDQVGPARAGLQQLGPAGHVVSQWRHPSRAPAGVLSGDPELVDAAVVVLTGFWSDRQLLDRAAAYPDGRPIVVATGADRGVEARHPPRTVADLLAGLARCNAPRQGGDIDVRFVLGRDADGRVRRRVIVDIPGTKNWNPSPAEPDPTSFGTNVRAITGSTTTYEAGVRAAMRRAGVRRNEPVLLVGHSQGGMVAVNLARHARSDGEFQVSDVVTAGAPIARIPVPRSVQVLALENDADVVPHCDGADNQDRTNVTTVTVHRDTGDPLANHSLEQSYLPGARDVDATDDPSVRGAVAGLRPFLEGTAVSTVTYHVERR